MAAGITPFESGLVIEPVDLVMDWARTNHFRKKFDEPQIEYEEFKEKYRIMEGR